MLAINIGFVVMGFVILPSKPDVGFVTLAFFGSCLVVASGTILRKFRFRRFSAENVQVPGGVPIRQCRALFLILGGWLLMLGTILAVVGAGYPMMFRILGGGVGLVGLGLFAAAVAGWLPGGFLQFDPDHLTIGQGGWLARIPWDAIAGLHEGELHSNPVLFIVVSDLGSLTVEPPSAAPKAMKSIARSRGLMGADFTIMSAQYCVDLPVLSDAIARFANEPAARKELGLAIANE